jgi:hypothetical protein
MNMRALRLFLVLLVGGQVVGLTASDRLPSVSEKVHSTSGTPIGTTSYAPSNDSDSYWDRQWDEMKSAVFTGLYVNSEAQYDRFPYDLHRPASQDAAVERHRSDYTPNPELLKSSDTRWLLNGDLSVSFGVDDDIIWYASRARIHAGGIGARASWTQFSEDLLGGDRFTIDLIDLMALYRFYESRYWHLEIGLGGLAYHDSVGTEWGGMASIGTDLFIWEPIAIHANYSGGSVNDVAIRQASLGVGYLWQHWEARLGYRWTSFDDIDVAGFELGTAFWF